MQRSELEKLVEAWVRAVESGVLGAFGALVTSDVADTSGPAGSGAEPRARTFGAEPFEARARAFHGAFANVRVTVEELIAEGDGIAWRFTLRGEHCGPFMGLEATGRRVAISGVNFQRVTAGRVREHFTLLDRYELLQQLRAPLA
jgi:predicted ester cyclase